LTAVAEFIQRPEYPGTDRYRWTTKPLPRSGFYTKELCDDTCM